jgi:MinD-like ATPase involved in chromosome partitioning or flagellar assembly
VPDQDADGLIVTIRSPELAEPIDLRLPGRVPVGRLLPRLVEALRLPEKTYQLLRHGEPIAEGRSLFAARVLAGDTLSLRPAAEDSREARRDAVPAPPDRAPTSAAGAVHLADLLPSRIDLAPTRQGITVALWSGSAGGTGRTTLALALAVRAAERSETVALLALSEPAVSAYLGLPRAPNVEAFFEQGVLQAAEQTVKWAGNRGLDHMQIILGPTRPQEDTAGPDQIDALVAAAQTSYDCVLLDLPPLVPGGTPWATTPLARADAVVLVASPSAAGVAATVTALSAIERTGGRATVQLTVVRRAPGGLPLRALSAGITSLWGKCPAAIEVPFWGDLPSQLDRGELPGRMNGPAGGLSRDGQRWAKAIEAVAKCLTSESGRQGTGGARP